MQIFQSVINEANKENDPAIMSDVQFLINNWENHLDEHLRFFNKVREVLEECEKKLEY